MTTIAPDGEKRYSIEVFDAVGRMIVVVTVSLGALEALREDVVWNHQAISQVG